MVLTRWGCATDEWSGPPEGSRRAAGWA